MTSEARTSSPVLNVIKWLFVAVCVAAAVFGGNYEHQDIPAIYRILAVVGVMLVGFGIAAFTNEGIRFRQYFKEANIERRKVVWPTRPETTQTTMIVVAVVIFMGFVLWLLDLSLGWIISQLIG